MSPKKCKHEHVKREWTEGMATAVPLKMYQVCVHEMESKWPHYVRAEIVENGHE